MLRTRRDRLYGVGPRSAHIAGLAYSCFELPDRLTGAVAEVIAPCLGDPHEYVALRLADGGLAAITLTCAANVLGLPRPDDYCYADAASARVAFDAAGRLLRLPGDEVARRMLDAAGEVVCELVLTTIKTSELREPQLVVGFLKCRERNACHWFRRRVLEEPRSVGAIKQRHLRHAVK